ncbi:armadillo-like helical domain-containing protein 4 [Mus pahari]|uniref:armadillo-like helical domain-containing protein 4 n=1 Tax=Mus pahari TaxID=10093 RepID=UPI000A310859|nr:armadillo-like helical domain-containing protein 4 [Mus pahari]
MENDIKELMYFEIDYARVTKKEMLDCVKDNAWQNSFICPPLAEMQQITQTTAESIRDSIIGIVSSFNLFFPSTMSRPTLMPSCVAFCTILFLTLATGCGAFPKVERRETAHEYAEKEQSQKMNTDDQENISFAPKYMLQQMSSEAPMVLSEGPSVIPLHKVFSVDKESHLPGAGLLHPTSPGVYSSSEPVVSASEQEHGPSQLETMSSEHSLSKAMLTLAVSPLASLNPDQEGPYNSSSTQPIVEAVTDVTHSSLEYLDNQLFAAKSQEAVSLGNSPSSSINTKEPEKIKADAAAMGTTAFPGADSTRDTEPDKERPSEMAADDGQSTTTKHLVTVPKNVLTIEPTAGSILGGPKVTVSVSTAGPVSSVFREEWDDTTFENISQGRPPEPGDNAGTQVRTKPPHGTYESFEGTEESPPSTAVIKVAPGLLGGEPALGTALVTALGDERSQVLTHQTSFTPMSLAGDPEVSTMKLFPSAGGLGASTGGDKTQLSSETAVSTSQYESVPQQEAGNVLKDITQEMTMATQETDATLPVVTHEHMATIESPRGSGEPEEGTLSSLVSADAELSRRWESLAMTASTTVVPLSLKLTSSIEGQ